jgi:hypothetical protein
MEGVGKTVILRCPPKAASKDGRPSPFEARFARTSGDGYAHFFSTRLGLPAIQARMSSTIWR